MDDMTNYASMLLMSIVVAAFLAAVSYLMHDQDFREGMDPTFRRYKGKRATSYTFFMWVIAFVGLGLTAVYVDRFGAKALAACFSTICFQVSAYLVVFLLLRPLLKEIVKPSTLVLLFVIPNFLHFGLTHFCRASEPIIEIKIKPAVFERILLIWVIGIAVVFIYFLVNHLLYRNKIKKNSKGITEETVLAIWNRWKEAAGIDDKYKIKLLESSVADTPFTIGATAKTLFVVLPEKQYGESEYELIFEHELTHAVRGDSGKKLFLMFCLAVCWFNPLVWLGIKNCYEDIELSCDEFILLDADETKRKKYADLILRSAAKTRGITSSLSKSAKSLGYRLEQIINKKRKLYGVIVAGVMPFALFMTNGFIAFSTDKVINVGILFVNPKLTKILSSVIMFAVAILIAFVNGRMVGGGSWYYADFRLPGMVNYHGKSEAREIQMDKHKSDDATYHQKFKWDKQSAISVFIIMVVMAAILIGTIKLTTYLQH